MGQTLAERIQYEAAYDRNLIFKAYAGDLADLMSELTTRAERAEAALAKYRAELADRLYEPCVWRIDENANDYITGCDGDWFDVSFGGMKYCPNCGHPVRIASSHNDLLSPDQEDR